MARKNLLKGFKKPKGISFEPIDSTNPNYQKFYAYPFETGFGTTVGNTLRRVLLSSIQGYAITSIRITSYDESGISHIISSEFEAIPNVAEDTLEIINSLKMIRLCLPEDVESDTIQYEFKGPGVVKSDDFAKEGQLEVKTKDQVIFTMMEGAQLDIEIQVDLGRGYVPAETNEHYIEAELSTRGLSLGRLIYVKDLATNNVLRQLYRRSEIEPGTQVEALSRIDLELGLNPDDNKTDIPNVVGCKYLRAVEVVHDNYLNIRKLVFDKDIKTYSDSLDAIVYKQSPEHIVHRTVDDIEYEPERRSPVLMGSEVTLYLTLDKTKLKSE